ncbi:MAG TPA: hypothetical protein PKD85_06900 [Saprospiraceae bacterium]|nr:hypothetical protein [Saprospiraceae bacterium]
MEMVIALAEEQSKKYEVILNKQGQMLAQHEQIFRQMFGGKPLPSPPKDNFETPSKESDKESDKDSDKDTEEDMKQDKSPVPVKDKSKKLKKKKDVSPEDIDKIIQAELEKERLGNDGEIIIETKEITKDEDDSKSLKNKKKER